jgi:rhamnose transport system permease protein
VVLWNTQDLGYLTVQVAQAVHDGRLVPGATSLAAGRLGPVAIDGSQILLGRPFVFTKANIDAFRF